MVDGDNSTCGTGGDGSGSKGSGGGADNDDANNDDELAISNKRVSIMTCEHSIEAITT